jgi:hypothetical protein
MKARNLKRRHDDRTLHRWHFLADLRAEMEYWDDAEDHYFHDDDGEVHDRTCRECDGTGGDRWNDGILPCPACDGQGYEWWK